jgi:hypothetical protein
VEDKKPIASRKIRAVAMLFCYGYGRCNTLSSRGGEIGFDPVFPVTGSVSARAVIIIFPGNVHVSAGYGYGRCTTPFFREGEIDFDSVFPVTGFASVL